MSQKIRKSHPLFDARLMYQLLELQNTLKLLVEQHEQEELDTNPYAYVLDAVENSLPLIREQFSLKTDV